MTYEPEADPAIPLNWATIDQLIEEIGKRPGVEGVVLAALCRDVESQDLTKAHVKHYYMGRPFELEGLANNLAKYHQQRSRDAWNAPKPDEPVNPAAHDHGDPA